MRAVLQRVTQASVTVDGQVTGRIGQGILVFAGIEDADTEEDLAWMAGKILRMRLLDDEAGVANKSVLDLGAGLLVVSQFTLFASTKKGNRPSYTRAGEPVRAKQMYERFVEILRAESSGLAVETGVFGANMKVQLTNDGPFTIWVDSRVKE